MKRAIYPGTFDPITLGHYDVIERISKLFDDVIVLVIDNKNKVPLFLLEKRVKMIQDSICNIKNVRVDTSDILTVQYAKENNVDIIVRSIRDAADFEYERQMAFNNKLLNKNIETVFIMPDSSYVSISSSFVRELLSYGRDISKFVPNQTLKYY